MLIRSMSPAVIAVDELGKEEDFKAVESVIHCGCKLIAQLMEIRWRMCWERLFFQMREMKVF